MESLKKKIASWEIKHGQIAITGEECKKLFTHLMGKRFNLETFLGDFPDRHLLESGYSLRLACKPFISQLSVGDTIYLRPSGVNAIVISKKEPTDKIIDGQNKSIEIVTTTGNSSVAKYSSYQTLINISENIKQYIEGKGKYKGRLPGARYASFDYCFNYFQSFKDNGSLQKLSDDDNIQISCLQLGFYLASWGMFRGSSFLLETSVRYLMRLIENIAKFDKNIWAIDVDKYSKENIDSLLECKSMIISSLGKENNPTDTLVTKIMLGVFGNVPAFDDNFCRGMELRKSMNRQSLPFIMEFYQKQQTIIDQYEIFTLDFHSGKETERKYTKAKIIDMIGFIEGINKRRN